jgi:hypothetical protein
LFNGLTGSQWLACAFDIPGLKRIVPSVVLLDDVRIMDIGGSSWIPNSLVRG